MGAREPGFDVLIAGGGLAGAGLALSLLPLGLRVGVVEARPRTEPTPVGDDDRGIALSESSRRILRTVGLWARLEAHATPIRVVHVSETGRAGSVRLDAAELGLEAVGWVVPAPALGAAFGDALAAADLESLQPARVVSVEQSADTVAVGIERDGVITETATRLLVAADGADSTVRTLAGFDAETHDYGQTAIVCNVDARQPHQGVAYERFTPDGPLAFLPLSGSRCAVVWTVKRDAADAILALDDDAFLARVDALFGGRLGPLARPGRRRTWPLSRTLAHGAVKARVVLVGNAAHSLHPIAGQGFNLSLRDCAALTEAIRVGMAESGDPAAPGPLAAWTDSRRTDQRRVGGFIDGLNGVFSADYPGAGALRASGLAFAGLFGPLRRAIARFGAGLR